MSPLDRNNVLYLQLIIHSLCLYYSMSLSLFGFSSLNCCNKNGLSQKVANTLLPFSYALWAQAHKIPISVFSNNTVIPFTDSFENTHFDTEVCHNTSQFVHSPPHDVQTTHQHTRQTEHYESKVILYKERKTELILRQDCYAFNCLQSVFIHNPSKEFADLNTLLSDPTVNESPYLWMLMWKETPEKTIAMDMVIFSDLSVLRMVEAAATSRSKEACTLINHALSEHYRTGVMTYKAEKSSTVPHQKVSLFPFRDIEFTRSVSLEYQVKASDLVLNSVTPDKNLWQEIEKSKLQDQVYTLEEEIRELREKLRVYQYPVYSHPTSTQPISLTEP